MSFLVALLINFAAQADCNPATELNVVPYTSPYDKDDTASDYSLAQMKTYFDDIYKNGNRKKERIYFDEDLKQFVAPFKNKIFIVPQSFIEKIVSHVNLAIKNGYAEFIFFPDMGHGHIFTSKPLNSLDDAVNSLDTKILYHTAEYLKSPSEFRYLNRNLIGNIENDKIEIIVHSTKQQPFNTVRSIPGFTELDNALVYLQANHKGCFSYKKEGQTYYFDIGF